MWFYVYHTWCISTLNLTELPSASFLFHSLWCHKFAWKFHKYLKQFFRCFCFLFFFWHSPWLLMDYKSNRVGWFKSLYMTLTVRFNPCAMLLVNKTLSQTVEATLSNNVFLEVWKFVRESCCKTSKIAFDTKLMWSLSFGCLMEINSNIHRLSSRGAGRWSQSQLS